MKNMDVIVKNKKVQNEQFLQQSMIQWFKCQYPLLIHNISASANGGKRDAKEGARLKKMGVLKGELDIFISVIGFNIIEEKTYLYGGLYFEVKYENAKPSKEQMVIINARRIGGYRVEIVNSLDQFISIVKEYLSNSLSPYSKEKGNSIFPENQEEKK